MKREFMNEFTEYFSEISGSFKGPFTYSDVVKKLKLGDKKFRDIFVLLIDEMIEKGEARLFCPGKNKSGDSVYIGWKYFETRLNDYFSDVKSIFDENETYEIFKKITECKELDIGSVLKFTENYTSLIRFDERSRSGPVMLNLYRFILPAHDVFVTQDTMNLMYVRPFGDERKKEKTSFFTKQKKSNSSGVTSTDMVKTAFSLMFEELGQIIVLKDELFNSTAFMRYFANIDLRRTFDEILKSVYDYGITTDERLISLFPDNWLDISSISKQMDKVEEDKKESVLDSMLMQYGFVNEKERKTLAVYFLSREDRKGLFQVLSVGEEKADDSSVNTIFSSRHDEYSGAETIANNKSGVYEENLPTENKDIDKDVPDDTVTADAGESRNEVSEPEGLTVDLPDSAANTENGEEDGSGSVSADAVNDIRVGEEIDFDDTDEPEQFIIKSEIRDVLPFAKDNPDAGNSSNDEMPQSETDDDLDMLIDDKSYKIQMSSDEMEDSMIPEKDSGENQDINVDIAEKKTIEDVFSVENDFMARDELSSVADTVNDEVKEYESEDTTDSGAVTEVFPVEREPVDIFIENEEEAIGNDVNIESDASGGTVISESECIERLFEYADESDRDNRFTLMRVLDSLGVEEGYYDMDILNMDTVEKLCDTGAFICREIGSTIRIMRNPIFGQGFFENLSRILGDRMIEKEEKKPVADVKYESEQNADINDIEFLRGKSVTFITVDDDLREKVEEIAMENGFEIFDGLAYRPDFAVLDKESEYLIPIAKNSGIPVMDFVKFKKMLNIQG